MTEMSDFEKKRVKEQRTALGEEGLNAKHQRLEKATKDNEVQKYLLTPSNDSK